MSIALNLQGFPEHFDFTRRVATNKAKIRLFSALMSEILSKIEHALLIRNGGLPDF